MSLTIKGLDIYLTRGDDTSLTVSLKDSAFAAGDEVKMTVRDRAGRLLFTKTVTDFAAGKAVIDIGSSDTAGKKYGAYRYDIEYTDSSGLVRTIIPPTGSTDVLPFFYICGEVTYD